MCDFKMKLFAFLLLWLMVYVKAEIYKLEKSQLDKMPPHIDLDLYKECLQEVGGVYCSGFISYVVDEPSALFTMMEEYSSHTATHFNRTKSFYGVCVTQKCKDFYKKDKTQDLGWVLETCLNHTVWEKHNLKVRVENRDLTCKKYGEKEQIDGFDIVVGVVVVALIMLNVIGSFLDICRVGESSVTKLLLCFSIPRNWRKLIARPINSSGSKHVEFQALYGVRAIMVTTIIITHSVLLPCYSDNPDYVEGLYLTNYMYALINGPIFTQIYLVNSGFLLVYYLQLYSENNTITWKILPIAVIKRWIRISLPYTLILGVVATWIRHIDEGPLWNELVGSGSSDCRRYWWWHLLYLNNYVDNSTCLLISWCIATDTQLYCMGVILFIICHKSKCKTVILSCVFIVGMIIPALHTYFQDLDGMLIVSPSSIVGKYLTNPTFIATYKRGHTNIPGYIIGMTTGYLVYHLQKTNFDISKYRKWRYLVPYWALFASQWGVLIYCKVLYEGPRPHILYRVLTAAFMKPLFGLAYVVYFVGMVFKLEKFYLGINSWYVWTVLGRVSLAAILLHVLFIETFVGAIKRPFTATYTNIMAYGTYFQVVTFISACVFWMTVEAPLAQVVKLTTAGSKDQLNGSNDYNKQQNGEQTIKKLN